MPDEEVDELNYFLGLINSANRELGGTVTNLAFVVDNLARRLAWLLTLEQWQADNPEEAAFVEELRKELADGLRKEAGQRWQELGAVEAVWDEIGAELGEHPAHPRFVQSAEESKVIVRRVLTHVAKRPSFRPPDPSMVETSA
jgi:hypothetical protein